MLVLQIRNWLWVLGWLTLTDPLEAQHLSFIYRGPEHGMRVLPSSRCLIDDYGHFWMATLDGLVRYNGVRFDFFNTNTHAEILSDDAGDVFKDSRNRIWWSHKKGLVMIDHKRQFHRIIPFADEPDRANDVVFEADNRDIIIISQRQAFRWKEDTNTWTPQPWIDSLITGDIREAKSIGDGRVLLTMASRVVLINTTDSTILYNQRIPHLNSATWAGNHLYVSLTGRFTLLRISPQHNWRIDTLPDPDFVDPTDDGAAIQYCNTAADGNIYMTTARIGLIRYEVATGTYTSYRHDPVDPFSVMDDRLRYIYADDKGNLLLNGITGICHTNVYEGSVRYYRSQLTTHGKLMNGRVSSITEDGHQRLWLTTDDGLYRLDLAEKVLMEIALPVSSPLYTRTPFPTHAAYDGQGRIWVAYHGDGIAVFTQEGKHVRSLGAASYPGYDVDIARVRNITRGEDGWMYMGCSGGFFRIRSNDFVVDTFAGIAGFDELRRQRIVDVFASHSDLWIAASPNGGVWHYAFGKKQLRRFTTEHGLQSNRVYAVGVDSSGNALVGNFGGLVLITSDGIVHPFQKGHDIPYTRVEAIEHGPDGSLWVTNTSALLRFDPLTRKLLPVTGEPHLSDIGFQIASSTSLSSGKMAFGVQKGFILFDPARQVAANREFDVLVFFKNLRGHEILCTAEQPIVLSYREQLLRFDMGINNPMLAEQMLYRYRITGSGQEQWTEPSTTTQLHINLRPGQYALEVQANNGLKWIDASGPIRIVIHPPFWQTWWFISALIISIGGLIFYFFQLRINHINERAAVRVQMMQLKSTALRAQMSPHFIFNSMNAIQECVVTGKIEEAYIYLSKFSRLLRLVLEHSDKKAVQLQDELEVLTLYLMLEQLRFNRELEFSVQVDPELDAEEIYIPPMVIQPHLENAVWHGLREKAGEKKIDVVLEEFSDTYVRVIVTDNGIGRAAATALQSQKISAGRQRSMGSAISGEQLTLLQQRYPAAGMVIDDLHDEAGTPMGTRITLILPMMEKPTFAISHGPDPDTDRR